MFLAFLKMASMVKCHGIIQALTGRQYLTAGVGPPPWLVPGSLSDVPGPGRKPSLVNPTTFNHWINVCIAYLYIYVLLNCLTLKHWEKLKLTCNLSNRALVQHHLSNPLLVDLNFIYVYHLCKSTGFQAPCSLRNTQCCNHIDGFGGKHVAARTYVELSTWKRTK